MSAATPIEEARNLGPTTGAELRTVGIATLADLVEAGWEEALWRVCERFPERLHLTMACALIGAIEGCDWRAVTPERKAAARVALARMKRDLR
ncbi:MAG: TfoX/Sxy family DNA transformation protein [Candidatus Sumerlaeia bacterium]|nr:TfoX/Sxy family DNA transformation protein [Candidatus Sumerlaeia bacterium]